MTTPCSEFVMHNHIKETVSLATCWNILGIYTHFASQSPMIPDGN